MEVDSEGGEHCCILRHSSNLRYAPVLAKR
jgi:hypothetical protein